MSGRIRANLDIILLVAIMFSMFFVVGVQAQSSGTTFEDSNCAIATATFTTGATVYGGGDFGLAVLSEIFSYVNPAESTVTANTYNSPLTVGFVCDSKGAAVGDFTGTWTLWITGISLTTTSSIDSLFTVVSSVPEFPLGVGYLILVILPLYVWLRKMRGRSSRVE